MYCGYCRKPFDTFADLRAHWDDCAAADPWRAFGKAPTRNAAREILYSHVGVTRPTPMSEETKARLRQVSKDPIAKAKSRAKKKERKELVRAISTKAHRTRRKR